MRLSSGATFIACDLVVIVQCLYTCNWPCPMGWEPEYTPVIGGEDMGRRAAIYPLFQSEQDVTLVKMDATGSH